MAYDFFGSEEEKDKEEQQTSPAVQQLGGENTVISGNQVQNSSQGPSSSGSFTNLQSYLDANKDQGFGKQVVGHVESDIQGAENAQNEAGQAFKSQADSNSVRSNDALLKEASESPTTVAGDEGKLAEFTKQRDAQYTGPQSFAAAQEIYQPAQTKTQQAYDVSKGTQDEGGRKAYLSEQYGAPAGRFNYTKGQQKLDNLLIQQDPESLSAFQDAWKHGDAAKNNFDLLSKELNNYAGNAASSTADARAKARSAIGLGDEGFTQDSKVLKDVADAKAKAAALNQQKLLENQKILQDTNTSNRKLTPEEMQKFGLGSNQQLFGENLAGYLNQAPDVDYNQAASPEQQSEVAALSKLAGLDNSYLPYADKAGQYDQSQFNTARSSDLATQLKTKQAAYNDEIGRTIINMPSSNTFDAGDNKQNGADVGGLTSLPIDKAIEYQKGLADYAAKHIKSGSVDTHNDPNNYFSPQIRQYQNLVKQLKAIQERTGYNDVVGGGGHAAGSYADLPSYLDYLRDDERAQYS